MDAVTVLAIRELLAAGPPRPPGPLPMVVYGTGPQARRHLQTMRSVLGPIDAAVIGRLPGAINEFIGETTRPGLAVRAGTPADVPGAAVVLTATSSPTPVVDAALIGPHTVVAAVGAHGPQNAALPPELVRRRRRRGAGVSDARRRQSAAGPHRRRLGETATGQSRRSGHRPVPAAAGHPRRVLGCGNVMGRPGTGDHHRRPAPKTHRRNIICIARPSSRAPGPAPARDRPRRRHDG